VSVVLSLAPGLALGAFILAAAPILESRGLDPVFALFGGIGLVIVPLELGWLACVGRARSGSWSPLAAVTYRTRLPLKRLLLLASALAAWFILTLVLWMALVEGRVVRLMSPWLPQTIRQFAEPSADGGLPGAGVLVALLVIAFVFNGLLGPVTEELYFRGYLLPRLDRLGPWAPVLNTLLFALYHVWTPWRWPQIAIGFLPLAMTAWRTRSLYVSLAAHVAINLVFLVMLSLSFLPE
jgi:membrane protease YdiL (CAAX protease family)